jgi:hypothetical protein
MAVTSVLEEYAVYEIDGDGFNNFIGTVKATNKTDAKIKANSEYGAPIRVTNKSRNL